MKQRLFGLKSWKQRDPALAPALLPWLVLMVLAGPIGLCAQTNTGRPTSNHYLLLVETSRAMSHRAHGVSDAVKEILDSNLKGEWRPGDTLAVWTFKEDSSTNFLPSVKLPLDAKAGSKTRLINFLQGPAYEKRDPFDESLPSLDRLVQGSNFTTVILVSAGDGELQGTPFDDRINKAYRQWQEEQKKLRLPFITVLRAVRGKFTHWSVTPAQWPLEMPPFPKEPQLVAEKSSQAPELAGKPAPSSALQLAISSVTRTQLSPLADPTVPAKNIVMLESGTAPPTLLKPVPESKAPPLAPPAPAAVAARIETKPQLRSPVEIQLPDWPPFDKALKQWLTAEDLPAPPNAPRPAVIAARIEIKPPTASINTAEQKPFELALAGWEPLYEAMKRWPPAKELPAPPTAPRPVAIAALIEIKQPAASVNITNQKPFELALADWELLDEAMKRWPPAKELPAVPKTPMPESSPQPASTASPFVSTKNVLPQETKPPEATALKPLPESLGAPASLPATILAGRNAGSETGASESTVSMGGQPALELPEEVIESKTAPDAPAVPEVAAAPPAGFLRENAGALAALLLAGIATTLCFMNWLRSYFWPARKRPVMPNLALALMPPPQPKLLGPGQPAPRKPSPLQLRETSP